MERHVSKSGKRAVTHYEVIEINEEKQYSIVSIIIETGRTHQIRVHMAYIGHPILGDTLYGKESKLVNRQALHASSITFTHPITKKQMEVIAAIPSDIQKLI